MKYLLTCPGIKHISKGVIIDPLFFKLKESCWTKVYRFMSLMTEKKLKKKVCRQNQPQECTLYAISKDQKWASIFWKTPETKKMHYITFK